MRQAVSPSGRGFTLVELVIGIVVFAVALAFAGSFILPQAKRSIDPIFQVRATELGQSLLSEIQARSFDEHSDHSGGQMRCGEDMDGDGNTDFCTDAPGLGCEEAGLNRDLYDDVDDYLCLTGRNAVEVMNTPDRPMTDSDQPLYQGFMVAFEVFYDADMDGINDFDTDGDGTIGSGTANLKLIRVHVTTPNQETISFATYRGNY
ncbi:type IV pilus modification PilV family protein [Bowmanella dokdonensis]|uniref:Type II secretion system protein n=1 Tax=Bowmanella dokdonensis TaxID=751969 RepID=A0A939IPN4_9ALTE|nr:type II secretion system protein [Bowmanella dokdonensis]MBN7826065.1 type II secretion system protein [Bowmanella dokdonensis]